MTPSDRTSVVCCSMSRYYDNLLNEMLIMSQYPVLTIPSITTLTQYFSTNLKISQTSLASQASKLDGSSCIGIHGK